MNWLAIILAFQVGTSSNQIFIDNSSKYIEWSSPSTAFYTQMEMGIKLFDHITINSFMKSFQTHYKDIYFAPYEIDYGFNSFIEYDHFKLGFLHQCNHPVISCFDFKTNSYNLSSNTEIYLRYELKINSF